MMREVTVGENDAGQRLDKFLAKTFRHLPAALLYKAIRKKDVQRNGRRCTVSERLFTGDVIRVYLPDEVLCVDRSLPDFMQASPVLDVVYEDSRILLLNKPVGLLVHPDGHEYGDTLIGRVQRYLYEKGEYAPQDEHSFAPALVNRIDRNTSGIVIAAKTASALRLLNAKLKSREIEKQYLCLVYGHMPKSEDTLDAYLDKNERQNRVTIHSDRGEGRRIVTRYKVLGEQYGVSLLEIDLLTGRTHQIRAHLASIGHPVVGDGKYGRNERNRRYGITKQALCSYRLTFAFRTDAGELNDLNGKSFELKHIWFREAFNRGEIRPR